jgi:hypothetical protein
MHNIAVTCSSMILPHPGFAWLIRRGLTSVQLVTTVHKSLSDTLSSSSDWTLHCDYSDFQLNSVVLPQFSFSFLHISLSHSVLLQLLGTGPTENTVFCCQECVLARYLVMDVLLLRAYALGMCLPRRFLAMYICVTICTKRFGRRDVENCQNMFLLHDNACPHNGGFDKGDSSPLLQMSWTTLLTALTYPVVILACLDQWQRREISSYCERKRGVHNWVRSQVNTFMLLASLVRQDDGKMC